MYYSIDDLQGLGRIERLNLINSVTGIKPANLIGTASKDGDANLAIFSSVVHLGSDPALIGFVFRPQDNNPRDTYKNIKDTGIYTINQVPLNLAENAHFTSAKFDPITSEFDACGFTEQYLGDFKAPYVKECQLKIGLELEQMIPLEINNTLFVIGRIVHLYFPQEMQQEDGSLNLEVINTAGVGGVNTYYSLKRESQYPYAHLASVPNLKKK